MTKEYQDLQHLDNEENDHQHRKRPLPPHSFSRRLCTGPSLLLVSMGLSLLLLVVLCVIGSQNSKLQEELSALRETFSNLTVSTEAKVKALSVQGGNVGRKVKSLESQLEKQQQELNADHSSLLLHVKQFVSDLRSLSCQMAVFQGNGSEKACCPVNWIDYEGSCYWFSRSGKPWPEAEKYCQLENAHLVVVGSWEEQHHLVPSSPGSSPPASWGLGGLLDLEQIQPKPSPRPTLSLHPSASTSISILARAPTPTQSQP